jgi:hypothetical protein
VDTIITHELPLKREEVSSYFHDLLDDASTTASLYSVKWQDDRVIN